MPRTTILEFENTKESINLLMGDCLKKLLKKGIIRYGLNTTQSEDLIEGHIFAEFPECVGNFEMFRKEGSLVSEGITDMKVKINEESVTADLEHPLTFRKEEFVFESGSLSYSLPRIINEKINSGSMTKITSGDGSMILDIAQGTDVNSGSSAIYKAGIKIFDRFYEDDLNPNMVGMLVYESLPAKLTFSKPATVYFYYDDENLDPAIDENELTLGYYDANGYWIGLSTQLDTASNKITADIREFSAIGFFVDCDPGKRCGLNYLDECTYCWLNKELYQQMYPDEFAANGCELQIAGKEPCCIGSCPQGTMGTGTPYYNQCEWGKTDLCYKGCGPTSVKMVLEGKGLQEPKTAINAIQDCAGHGFTEWQSLARCIKQISGHETEHNYYSNPDEAYSRIKEEIDKGNLIVYGAGSLDSYSSWSSTAGSQGHFFVVAGYYENTQSKGIIINDPFTGVDNLNQFGYGRNLVLHRQVLDFIIYGTGRSMLIVK
ncbi:C39 family peptidase [Candidatus Woesearchaeota archaeon]|nr:C39 family peptidase [Candidatus Woesearchaeota archaeon]